jgi:hypothetical protein
VFSKFSLVLCLCSLPPQEISFCGIVAMQFGNYKVIVRSKVVLAYSIDKTPVKSYV